MSNADNHEHLLRGLVGDIHGYEWQHNPLFRASIQSLAKMLPAMVSGIADECRRTYARQEEATDLMSRGLITPVEAEGLVRGDFDG